MRIRFAACVQASLLIAFSGVASAAPAPDYYEEQGLSPYREPQTDADVQEYVDPFSGLLHRRYVDLHIPGNGGLDIDVIRAYNNVQAQNFTWFRNPVGIGWTIHFGRVLINTDYHICNKSQNVTSADNPVLEHADGRKELLYVANATGPYSSYLYVTPSRWKAVCTATSNGLIVTSPEGIEYTMDVIYTGGIPAYYTRLIRDRNGNQLTISYKPGSSSVSSTLIDKVSASDGRLVEFFYANETTNAYRLTSIRANGQIWQYEHTQLPELASPTYQLTTVRRPDNSTWTYTYFDGNAAAARYSLKSVGTPLGGATNYTYAYVSFGNNIQTTVLASKSIAGTNNTPAASWTYAYVPGSTFDKTTITGPGVIEEHKHFGYLASGADQLGITTTVWKIGLPLEKSIYSSTSSLLERQTFTWDKQLISLENQARNGRGQGTDTESYAPLLTQKVINRDGTNYTTAFSSFDGYGNPQTIVETGSAGARRTDLVYLNNTTKWLLREFTQKTIQGIGTISRVFNTTGNMTSESRFGVTTAYAYTTQGDISQTTDARSKITTFSSYKRGIARTENRPEGVSISRVVNDTGTVASVTDGRGYMTSYTYDNLNRLTGVTPPIASPISISRSATAKTRTLTQGSFQEVTNFDSFGRAIMVTAGGVGITTKYDEHGRTKFKSYQCFPVSGGGLVGIPACPDGRTLTFDALGRVTKEQTPTGTTTFTYQTGGNVRLVTPRSTIHTHEYKSYGDPNERLLTKVITPNLTTTISRNALGMLTSVSQGSYTRNWAYDSRMFLTSVTDPETGTTTLGRDAVGNLTGRAVNSSVSSASTAMTYDDLSRLKTVSYSSTSSFESASAITYEYDKNDNVTRAYNAEASSVYTYDALNGLQTQSLQVIGGPSFGVSYAYNSLHHLASVTYPSGRMLSLNPDVLGRPQQVGSYLSGVAYHPNNAPQSLSFANGVTSTTTLTSEQQRDVLQVRRSNGAYVVNLDHAYDQSGNLTGITDFVDSVYSAGFSYDGSDRLSNANGFWGSGSVTYDAIGNITNLNLGSNAKTFSYDFASNRLTQVTGSAGSWSLSYDPQGNTTADGRYKYRFNVANQLGSVLSLADVPVRTFGHDANGLRFRDTRNGVTKYFVYSRDGHLLGEYASNGTWTRENIYLGPQLVAVVENLPDAPASLTVPAQDADGTFTLSWSGVTGATTYQLYEATSSDFAGDQQVFSGSSISTTLSGRSAGTYYYRVRACAAAGCGDFRVGSNSLQVIPPPSAPGPLIVPASDDDGNYVISWGSATGQISSYELQEALTADFSNPTSFNVGLQTSYNATSRGSGTYYYRARACNSLSCGPYRTGDNSVVVLLPPGTPASISVPASDADGSYSISWGTATGSVTAYELYESTSAGFASQTLIFSGSALSGAVSGRTEGTYYYRVRACNTSGCGGYRAGTNGTQVVYPPLEPGFITVPANDSDGQYAVSWGVSFGQVERYELYESISQFFVQDTLVYSGTEFSYLVTGRAEGTYYYRVRACNVSGCSGYRVGDNPVRVLYPPGAPASLTVPAQDSDGSFDVAWGTAPGSIDNYELYETRTNPSSSETLAYQGSQLSVLLTGRGNGDYTYRVRACNAGGCGPYRSGGNTLQTRLTPTVPSSISVPAYDADGSYTISWAASSGQVTAYELEEATASGFSPAVLVYAGTALFRDLSGRGQDRSYYYRVRACNDFSCSAYRTGSNPVEVYSAPGSPGNVTAPTVGTSSGYVVQWLAPASGTVTHYEVEECSGVAQAGLETCVTAYSGADTFVELRGRSPGVYQYAVRACNRDRCSAKVAAPNPTVVTTSTAGPDTTAIEPVSGLGRRWESEGSLAGGGHAQLAQPVRKGARS